MSVTPEQQREIYERDKGMCVICGKSDILDIHHAYFKGHYSGEDKNSSFNLVTLCRRCHSDIHGGDKSKEKQTKRMALKRYEGDNRERLLEIYEQRFGEEYGDK